MGIVLLSQFDTKWHLQPNSWAACLSPGTNSGECHCGRRLAISISNGGGVAQGGERGLAAKGYHCQVVFARNAGHVDGSVKQ